MKDTPQEMDKGQLDAVGELVSILAERLCEIGVHTVCIGVFVTELGQKESEARVHINGNSLGVINVIGGLIAGLTPDDFQMLQAALNNSPLFSHLREQPQQLAKMRPN